jgi:nickel-dependent lactate racemase
LADVAGGCNDAVLVVPDWTRPLPLPEILPVLLSRLSRAGLSDDRITIIVACGTHPGIDDERLRRQIGPLPAAIRVLQHDARDPSGLEVVGELRDGLPLRINRAVIEADVMVTLSGVRHHYFAGFGGGPKMVFPGLGGYREIQANHALVLRGETAERMLDERCRAGRLDGNPVAEEIARAAAARPPDFTICTVPGLDGGVAWAAAGSAAPTFAKAVERVRTWYEIPAPDPFELMVASGGGAPSDSTLIQGHKAFDAACAFLAPGCELLLAAALDRGLGASDMQPFVDDPRPQAIAERLAASWVQYGHTTLRLLDKTARFRVHLRSCFDEAAARSLGFEPITDPGTVLDRWREEFPGATVGVVTGPPVYPRH